MPSSTTRTLGLSAAASVLTSALWLALAWRSPTDTFHFAPPIAAGIGPYFARSIAGRQQARTALATAAVSAAVVILAVAALAIADRLQGPTFWSDNGAPIEAILFTAAGAAIGIAVLIRRPVAAAS